MRIVNTRIQNLRVVGQNTEPADYTVEYLVVAGGGAGGDQYGGGGGAGGFRTGTETLTGSTSYTVTVGAGGASTGANGASSLFGSITSAGRCS